MCRSEFATVIYRAARGRRSGTSIPVALRNRRLTTDPQFTDQGINNLAVSRGNESRNALTGPGINNWDIGLQKAFALRSEKRRLVFRADAFNAFNHTQWSGVNNYDDRLNNPQNEFGWVNGARAARRMQLNMRFVF